MMAVYSKTKNVGQQVVHGATNATENSNRTSSFIKT